MNCAPSELWQHKTGSVHVIVVVPVHHQRSRRCHNASQIRHLSEGCDQPLGSFGSVSSSADINSPIYPPRSATGRVVCTAHLAARVCWNHQAAVPAAHIRPLYIAPTATHSTRLNRFLQKSIIGLISPECSQKHSPCHTTSSAGSSHPHSHTWQNATPPGRSA